MVEKKNSIENQEFLSKSLWIEGPRCPKTHKKYQVNSDYLSTFQNTTNYPNRFTELGERWFQNPSV